MIGKPFALATAGVLAAVVSCTGTLPSGSPCTRSSGCETGLSCLYDVGSGCSASGHCVIPSSDCSGSATGLSLCGCNGAPLDMTCIPSTFALPQRTATGLECLVDAGADADAGDVEAGTD
jgi:hypothetical protein